MQAKPLMFLTLSVSLLTASVWADQLDPVPQPQIMSQAQGMQVYTLPDGRIHAEINYQEQNSTQPSDDTKHKFTFEGTRAEVREQIEKNSMLPEERKQALLQTLSGNAAGMGIFNHPMFGNGNPFDDPFFKDDPFLQDFLQNAPFNDDFFKKFFDRMPPLNSPPGFGSGQIMPQIQPPPLSVPPTVIPPVPPVVPKQNTPAGEGKGILL